MSNLWWLLGGGLLMSGIAMAGSLALMLPPQWLDRLMAISPCWKLAGVIVSTRPATSSHRPSSLRPNSRRCKRSAAVTSDSIVAMLASYARRIGDRQRVYVCIYYGSQTGGVNPRCPTAAAVWESGAGVAQRPGVPGLASRALIECLAPSKPPMQIGGLRVAADPVD